MNFEEQLRVFEQGLRYRGLRVEKRRPIEESLGGGGYHYVLTDRANPNHHYGLAAIESEWQAAQVPEVVPQYMVLKIRAEMDDHAWTD